MSGEHSHPEYALAEDLYALEERVTLLEQGTPLPPNPGRLGISHEPRADYAEWLYPVWNDLEKEAWIYGRGPGDDYTNPGDDGYQSPPVSADIERMSLENLRTDRDVMGYVALARDPAMRAEVTFRAQGPTKPEPNPEPPPDGEGVPAYIYPGSSKSPWKKAVGDDANFEQDQRLSGGVTFNVDNDYGHNSFRAKETDPENTVVQRASGGNPAVTSRFKIPADAWPTEGSDHHMYVFDPSGRWVDEHWDMRKTGDLTWECGNHVRTDLLSDLLQGGARACGMCGLAGEIKKRELDDGWIGHPIAIALGGDQLGMPPEGTPTGYPHVYPAQTQDGHYASAYFGNIPMGAWFALPEELGGDVGDRDSNTIVTAAYNYGLIVTDLSGGFTLYGEPNAGLETERVMNVMNNSHKWTFYLRRILNVSPTSIGGGGTPRVPDQPDPVAV